MIESIGETKEYYLEFTNTFIALSICVSQILQRNKTNRVCVWGWGKREREMYLKQLAHMIMKAGKSKTCRLGQQTGNPGQN